MSRDSEGRRMLGPRQHQAMASEAWHAFGIYSLALSFLYTLESLVIGIDFINSICLIIARSHRSSKNLIEGYLLRFLLAVPRVLVECSVRAVLLLLYCSAKFEKLIWDRLVCCLQNVDQTRGMLVQILGSSRVGILTLRSGPCHAP